MYFLWVHNSEKGDEEYIGREAYASYICVISLSGYCGAEGPAPNPRYKWSFSEPGTS
jgi:hypothetical protein